MTIAFILKGDGYYINSRGERVVKLVQARLFEHRHQAVAEIRAEGERAVAVKIEEDVDPAWTQGKASPK